MGRKKEKKLTDVGQNVPSNFKFGLIVAVGIFWAEFFKSVISYYIEKYARHESSILANFIIALSFTVVVYFILISYFFIRNKLKKIKIKK